MSKLNIFDLSTASMAELQATVKALPGTQVKLLAEKMFEAGVEGEDLLDSSNADDPEVLRSFFRESLLCEVSPFVVARIHSRLYGMAADSAAAGSLPPPSQGSLGAVTCEELADAIQAIRGRDLDNLADTVRLSGVTGVDISRCFLGTANDAQELSNLFAKCEAATLKPFVVKKVLKMLRNRWGSETPVIAKVPKRDVKTHPRNEVVVVEQQRGILKTVAKDSPAETLIARPEPIGAHSESLDDSNEALEQLGDERSQLGQKRLTHAPDPPKKDVEQGSARAESLTADSSTTAHIVTTQQSAGRSNESHLATSTTSTCNPLRQEGGGGAEPTEVKEDLFDQRCPTPVPWPPSLTFDYVPTDANADSLVAAKQLEPRATFAVFTELVVQKIPTFLRRLFCNLWSYRYDEEWHNEPKFGNMLLNGRADFSHLLGSAELVNGRGSSAGHAMVVDGDVRFFRDKPGEEGIRPGTRVCLELGGARQYFWVNHVKKMDSDAGAKTKVRIDGTFTAPGAVKHQPLQVNVYVQSRDFFDRQTRGNSSARYKEIQNSLLSGDLNDWDMTALMWVLLFSAHNTDAKDHNTGFVHARRHSKAASEGHEFEDLDARMKQLRAGLNELRELRNSLQHHRTCQYSPQDFRRGVLKVTRVMRVMDHLSVRLGWRWTLPEEHQPPHVARPATSAEEFFLVLSQLVKDEYARSLASGPGGALELTNKILALKKQMDDEQDRYAEKIRHLERHKRDLERHHQLSQKLRHIDRYSSLRVHRQLAVGRQAIVLHCSLSGTEAGGTDVALKVFWPEDVESSSSLSLLYKEPGRREIDILSNLSPHDNVVNPLTHLTSQLTQDIIDQMPRERRSSAFSFANRRHSRLDAEGLVMELYDGSLAEFHKRFAVSPQTWLDVGIQVLQGVHHYSRSGIVHFDLKLDNILFKFDETSETPETPGSPGCVVQDTGDGGDLFVGKIRVAISDFGAAFNEGQNLSPAKELSVYSFNVDRLFGNKAHRAPEVLVGIQKVKKSRALSPNKKYLVDLSRNDVFAAGVVLAEMVLGHHPVASAANGSKYGSHSRSYDLQDCKLEEDFAQLSDLVSPKFEMVVRGLLDFDPSRRMSLARAINILQAEEKVMASSASAHETHPQLASDSTEELSDLDDSDHLLLEEDENDDDVLSIVLAAEELQPKMKWDVTHSMWRHDDLNLFFDEQTKRYTRDPASGDFLSTDDVAAIQSHVAQKHKWQQQAYSSLVNEAEARAKDEPEALDAEEGEVVVDDEYSDDGVDGKAEHSRDLADSGPAVQDFSGGGGASADCDKDATSIPLKATSAHTVHPKHKTEPCMYWMTKFRCFRGGFEPAPGCPYAHGPNEFRGQSWEEACARLGVSALDLETMSKECGDDSFGPRASTKTDAKLLENLARVQRDDVHHVLRMANSEGIVERLLPAQFRMHFNRPLQLGSGSISQFMQLVGGVHIELSLQSGRLERVYRLSGPSIEQQQLQQGRVNELLEQAGCDGIQVNAFEETFLRKFGTPFQCWSHRNVYFALTSAFPFAHLCISDVGQRIYCSRKAAKLLQQRRVITLLRIEGRMLGSQFGLRFRRRYKCGILTDANQRPAEALALMDGVEVVPAPEFNDKWIRLASDPQFYSAPGPAPSTVPVSGTDLARIADVLRGAGPNGLLGSQFQPAFQSQYHYKLECPGQSLSQLVGYSRDVDVIQPEQSGLKDKLFRHRVFRSSPLPCSSPPTKKLVPKKCRHMFGPRRNCVVGLNCKFAHSEEELVERKRVLPQGYSFRSPAVSRSSSTASSASSSPHETGWRRQKYRYFP